MDGGTYRQAPYESMTEFEYHDMVASMPLGIDWDKLVEGTDNIEGAQTLACTAGACEI